jgi:hypothetical protein
MSFIAGFICGALLMAGVVIFIALADIRSLGPFGSLE